jgi:hypothetical protein
MPKSEPKNPGKAIPIMDVAHPGQSAPAANSKSVIVSSRPMMKDPMMVDGASDTDEVDRLVEADRPIEKATPRVEPLATPDAAADKDESDKPAEPDSSGTSDKLPVPATGKSDKTSDNEGKDSPASKPPAAKTDKTGEGQPAEAAAPDVAEVEATGDKDTAIDDKATQDTKAAEAAADQVAKHQAAIDKLADSQQYYLPINSVEKRRSQRFIGLGILLSLLLVVAWADVALDAGLISLSNIPHSHFFALKPVASRAATPAATAANIAPLKTSCGTVTLTDATSTQSPFNNCFNEHFQQCKPAQIQVRDNSTANKGSISTFKIIAAQGRNCVVTQQDIVDTSSPKSSGKSMTCPYDTAHDLYTDINNLLTVYDKCTGSLKPLLLSQ